MLSCRFSEISKNTFFTDHLRATASELPVLHPSPISQGNFSWCRPFSFHRSHGDLFKKERIDCHQHKIASERKEPLLVLSAEKMCVGFLEHFIFLRFITLQKQPPEVFCKKDVLRNWCSNKVAAWGLKLIKNRLRHFCRPAFFYRTCWTTASDFILHLDKPSLEFSDKFFHVW